MKLQGNILIKTLERKENMIKDFSTFQLKLQGNILIKILKGKENIIKDFLKFQLKDAFFTFSHQF